MDNKTEDNKKNLLVWNVDFGLLAGHAELDVNWDQTDLHEDQSEEHVAKAILGQSIDLLAVFGSGAVGIDEVCEGRAKQGEDGCEDAVQLQHR